MYLSGELPAKDRAVVEQRLVSDPAFAAEIERARAADAACAQAFMDSDRGRHLPVKQEVAVRRVSRAMHDWLVERAAASTDAPQRRHFHMPLWAYPVAVAASLI